MSVRQPAFENSESAVDSGRSQGCSALRNQEHRVGVQSEVGWEQRGVVTGANMFMRYVGSALGAAIFGSIVNSTLSNWLRHTPPAVAAQLPHSLNATTLVLGGSPSVGPAAADYVRQGLYTGVHRVFIASVVAAVATTLLVLVMPRRRSPLQTPQSPQTPQPAAGG